MPTFKSQQGLMDDISRTFDQIVTADIVQNELLRNISDDQLQEHQRVLSELIDRFKRLLSRNLGGQTFKASAIAIKYEEAFYDAFSAEPDTEVKQKPYLELADYDMEKTHGWDSVEMQEYQKHKARFILHERLKVFFIRHKEAVLRGICPNEELAEAVLEHMEESRRQLVEKEEAAWEKAQREREAVERYGETVGPYVAAATEAFSTARETVNRFLGRR